MAKLHGRDFEIGPKWFSLAPARSGEPNTDALQYTFELAPWQGEGMWSRSYSVADWLLGQEDLWVLARAFMEAPVLAQTKLPFNHWPTGKGLHAYLFVSAGWIQAALFGLEKQSVVRIVLFLQEGVDPTVFRRFFIQSSVEDAERFGRELASEIIQASPNWARERGLST